MKVWAVYTQFEPYHKYPETLETLHTTRELALKAAKEICSISDNVWISSIQLDTDYLDHQDYEKVK